MWLGAGHSARKPVQGLSPFEKRRDGYVSQARGRAAKHPTRTLALWGLKFNLMGYNFSLMRKPTSNKFSPKLSK